MVVGAEFVSAMANNSGNAMFTTPGARGRQGLSQPAPSPAERMLTPARRHLDTSPGPGGVGVSPVAKRPNVYVVPTQREPTPAATLEELTSQMLNIKDTVQAVHTWVQSIYDATVDHAGQLEGAQVPQGPSPSIGPQVCHITGRRGDQDC